MIRTTGFSSVKSAKPVIQFSLVAAGRVVHCALSRGYFIVLNPAAPSLRGGQIETQPLLFDIGRRQIDGAAARMKFEPGIGQRRRDPVPRLLHRRVRQADDDDEGVSRPQLTSTSTGKVLIPNQVPRIDPFSDLLPYPFARLTLCLTRLILISVRSQHWHGPIKALRVTRGIRVNHQIRAEWQRDGLQHLPVGCAGGQRVRVIHAELLADRSG